MHLRKNSLFLGTLLAVWLGTPTFAQTPIAAPSGWATQAGIGGAQTFSPPDLAPGEVYRLTIYEPTSMDGKTPTEWLRAFGGTVGTKPGQLTAPLKIKRETGRVVTGSGTYGGPNGTALGVVFIGVLPEGGSTIRVLRTLFSAEEELAARYQGAAGDLLKAMLASDAGDNTGREPSNDEPPQVAQAMTVGGDIEPGVYAGVQQTRGMFGSRSSLRLRVYLYANGEYRICDGRDEDFDMGGPVVGKIKYTPRYGLLNLGETLSLYNDNRSPHNTYCYYGRNRKGERAIIAQTRGLRDTNTYLTWVGAPTGRLSKGAEEAPAKALEAKRNRIQTVVAPGKGVPNSQIALVTRYYHWSMTTITSNNGFTGIDSSYDMVNTTDEAYLLLKDGTVYKNLQIAPDQFDIRASRRKEPSQWGLWKREGGKYHVSFEGAPYQPLPGDKVFPAAPQTRLNGRYGILNSPQEAVTFTRAGRFSKTGPAPDADKRADTPTDESDHNSPADRAGTYSISGYAMTLRYDSGKAERIPFFFTNKERTEFWFGGHSAYPDKKK